MTEIIQAATAPAPSPEDELLSVEDEFRRLERAAGDQQARLKAIAQQLGADPLAAVYHEFVGVVELQRNLTSAVGGNLAWLDERLEDLEEGLDDDGDEAHGQSQLTAADAALFGAGYEQTLRFFQDLLLTLPTDSSAAEQRAILGTLIQMNEDRLARVKEIALSPEESEEETDDAGGETDDDDDDDEPEA